MAEITPVFQMTFQSNLSVKFSNGWNRTLKKLWWQLLAVTQQSNTLKEAYEWMLETAQIRSTGSKGAELEFEDLVAQSFEITNENFGDGLRLSRNSIEDNKYDRAAQWSAQVGSAAAFWPQRQLVTLIQNGKVGKSYDGAPFFSASHPVNPFDASLGNYSNLFTALPLTSANVAEAVSRISQIKHPGDAPRYLEPEILVVDPSKRLAALEITGAEVITDPLNATQGAPATNMIKTGYSLGQPIVIPEFGNEPGVWYLGCKADQDALNGAFLYQERKPFELTSYVGATQADLDRLNVFEWHLRGRNAAAYGHPYLFFRCEPT
jgi:phage major head subunit gpT-like protein